MKAIDLFSGTGGATLGMQRSGIEVVSRVESDAKTALAYSELENPRLFSTGCFLYPFANDTERTFLHGALFALEWFLGGIRSYSPSSFIKHRRNSNYPYKGKGIGTKEKQ